MIDFLISNAWAQSGAETGSAWTGLLPLILIFVAFYFILIRPQMKRQKEHRQLVEALEVGDEVVTSGGLLGRVEVVGDSFLTIQLSGGTEIKVERGAVVRVMPKGTVDSA